MKSLITPSSAQMALCIAIIRSKPADTHIRDYVIQLRKQVKQGQLVLQPEEQGHYIDLVAYWQEQCRRLQEECDLLTASNVKLERSNRQLSSHASLMPESTGTDQPVKRKAASSVSFQATKRARRLPATTVTASIAGTEDGIEEDLEFLESLGKDGRELTEALFATHNCLRSSHADLSAICSSLVRTSRALSKVLAIVAEEHEHLSRPGRSSSQKVNLDQDKSEFALAFTVCARAFTSILVGLNRLQQDGEEGHFAGLIICEVADIFKRSLAAIETSARQTARASILQRASSKMVRSKNRASNEPRECRSARALAHFLISLFGFLDRADKIHRQLFDAFVFVLFEQVARRLYYCTFKRDNGASLERCLMPLPVPQTEENSVAINILAFRLEAKALVLILERAMGLAPNHMNPQKIRSNASAQKITRTISYRNIASASKAPLSSLAKDRLQRTLIRCMYGNHLDDEFLDVLTKPLPAIRIGSLPNVAKVDINNVEEWYTQEVWRLVGWDILAKEGDW